MRTQTSGTAPGFVQANLVILPRTYASDFLTFCLRNPKPCPLLDVTDAGCPEFKQMAPGADIRTDLPLYRIWRDGKLERETERVDDTYENDMVGFALGCSFSWEDVLKDRGLAPRHMLNNTNVPMFRTSVENETAGVFGGRLVVSMRPYKSSEIDDVVAITSSYPGAHGGPVHVGDPSEIGILDVRDPDFGDAVSIEPDDVPVFWACGVTPQLAIESARPHLAITHSPGHMLVCDVLNSELQVNGSDG